MTDNTIVTNVSANEYLTFDEAYQMVKTRLTDTLTTTPLPIRAYTTHLAQAQGKNIRAATLLVAAIDRSGKIHIDAVYAAVGIELLHLATLVHDDVIDNAPTRRGITTLNTKYDRRTAIICGDYLLCLALSQAKNVKKRDVEVNDYMTKICLGEMRQHQNNTNFNITPMTYFRIISGKTAALFEASVFFGGLICEDEHTNLKQYRKLGNYLGMIFQLTDDCIDFEETVTTAKKPVQSDFEQGVVTLPLIHALKHDKALKVNAESNKLTRAQINEAVKNAGSIAFTKSIAKRYYNKAEALLEATDFCDDKKARFTRLFDASFYGISGANVKN